MIEFSASTAETDQSSAAAPIRVEIDGETHQLSTEAAVALRDRLGAAIAGGNAFVHTAYERRADGAYALFRRGDDDPAKVFDSRDRLRAIYRSLPAEFVASDVTAVSGSRRHLLVRHFAEHPAFDCRLTCRNPLTVQKHATP